MSLSVTEQPRTFRIGLICAKGFDNPDFLDGRFGPHLSHIQTVYTNGVNPLVIDFCQVNGLVCTIFPISRTAPWSNRHIIENADKVYILSTPDSHNTELARKECERQGKPFEVVQFEPLSGWKLRVTQTQEILDNASPEEVAASPALTAARQLYGFPTTEERRKVAGLNLKKES